MTDRLPEPEFTQAEMDAQAWHVANCLKNGTDLSEGTCYCCCWVCPDDSPHYRAAMKWADNGAAIADPLAPRPDPSGTSDRSPDTDIAGT